MPSIAALGSVFEMSYSPVVIIGAPRSGTNILRDVLASLDGIGTWPCDEINYIWRHGNVRYPSDEIPVTLATSRVKRYIGRQFDILAKRRRLSIVLEKTCANSLRVPFVHAVLPKAKFIFIYRDGLDAAASARLRWTAQFDLRYVLQKARFVPASDLPYYALRYFWARSYRFMSKEKRLAFWGPCLNDMQSLLREYSLTEVCALQWARCVDKADEYFASLPQDRVVRVCYEDFVRKPESELKRILESLGHETHQPGLTTAVARVSGGSIGKGRALLGEDEISTLEALVGDSLKRYGYR